MQRLALLTAAFCLSAAPVFAVGTEDETPPTPTETTTECVDGQIYDEDTKACIEATDQSLNDDRRYDAVRELAYAGAYDRATAIINASDAPDDPRFLNYRGFIARKSGNSEDAMVFYRAALAKAPNYHLARSYMGQGLVAMGDIKGAKAQLAEIAARGGESTWAYTALDQTLGGKAAFDY